MFHYQTTIDAYKFSFFPRTVPKWNNLPSHINEQTLNSFKQSTEDSDVADCSGVGTVAAVAAIAATLFGFPKVLNNF